jgi:hypothetical protein
MVKGIFLAPIGERRNGQRYHKTRYNKKPPKAYNTNKNPSKKSPGKKFTITNTSQAKQAQPHSIPNISKILPSGSLIRKQFRIRRRISIKRPLKGPHSMSKKHTSQHQIAKNNQIRLLLIKRLQTKQSISLRIILITKELSTGRSPFSQKREQMKNQINPQQHAHIKESIPRDRNPFLLSVEMEGVVKVRRTMDYVNKESEEHVFEFCGFEEMSGFGLVVLLFQFEVQVSTSDQQD